MKVMPLFHLVCCSLLALSLNAHGISFPALGGTLHNPQSMDLSKAKFTVEVECNGMTGGACGKTSRTASFQVATGAFRFSAISVGSASRSLDYFKDGWGRRVDFTFKITLPSAAGSLVLYDLHYWAWEGRPGATLSTMVSTMQKDLADLTLYPVSGPQQIRVEGKLPADAGQARNGKQYYYLNFHRQFLPSSEAPAGTPARLVSRWLTYWTNTNLQAGEELSLNFEIGPMVAIVPGTPAIYGNSPQVRTAVHFYLERAPRSGERGMSFVPYGILDTEEAYSPRYLLSRPGVIAIRNLLPDQN